MFGFERLFSQQEEDGEETVHVKMVDRQGNTHESHTSREEASAWFDEDYASLEYEVEQPRRKFLGLF